VKSLRANLTALMVAIAISIGVRAIAADPAQSNSAAHAISAAESSTTEGSTATGGALSAIAGTFGAVADRDKQGWDIVTESLFLWRDNHTPYWVAGDFDMGVGPRIIATHEVDDDLAWEAEYFGVYGMAASATQSGYFQVFSIGFTDFGDNVAIPPDRYDTQQRYESSINNFELNAAHKLQAFSILAGFRYLRFDEQYQTTAKVTTIFSTPIPLPSGNGVLNPIGSVSELFSGSFRTTDNTENNLIGGQLGLRWRHDAGRLFCEATGKAGIFGNVYKISDEPTKSNTAFVGDLNFSAGLHVNDIWSVRAGYNLLWITDVALAPRQVLTSVMFPTPFNPDNRVFLHGANVGLEAAW
jgi:hypothetical protein